MAISSQMSTLESAGLITLVGSAPDIEYSFRHTLIQDAVYDSLLKSEQHNLHRITGEVLEQLFPDRREELSSRLAEHFWRAGDPGRALPYFLIAAERATRSYANTEAIDSYSSALKAAEGNNLVKAQILRARGLLYDTIGDFEASRADQEDALKLAEAAGDDRAAWESLINLGMLWSARDYRQTGKYYDRALSYARGLKDDRILASTLNWLGNYHINVEEPDQSQKYHLEALSIFNRLEDEMGIAETDDLLGMSTALGGDLPTALDYLREAVAVFEKLGKRHNLSSSLSTMSILGNRYQTDIAVTAEIPLREGLELVQKAYKIAVEIGWLSGEVFSLCNMALRLVSLGRYDEALQSIKKGIEIAENIHHRQWQTFTAISAGMLYIDICDWEKAQHYSQQALSLARQNYSIHWIHSSIGVLASAMICNCELSAAGKILKDEIPEDLPARTLGQRLVWAARADLALANNNPELALAISKRLVDEAIIHNKSDVILRLWMIRGSSLAAMAKKANSSREKNRYLKEAEELLMPALNFAKSLNYRSMTWRIHLALSKLYEVKKDSESASRQHRAAREIIHELADEISDKNLRRNFLTRALES
jgi:predicted ATPase